MSLLREVREPITSQLFFCLISAWTFPKAGEVFQNIASNQRAFHMAGIKIQFYLEGFMLSEICTFTT